MNSLTIFRRSPGSARTLSPIATDDTFESRFWVGMVIIAFYFFYLFSPGDEGRLGARA